MNHGSSTGGGRSDSSDPGSAETRAARGGRAPRGMEVTFDEKYGTYEARLANGLLALVIPQPDSPVVSVQTWYRVGSREEEKGRTGLAHFLEHLLFKGTKVLRRGDIDLVCLRNGGQNNADTTHDRTRYFFNFSRDRFERALEIEADRMRGSAFDEHEFRSERGPVLEELRRDRDDPTWRLIEAVETTAFHVHPYQNPVIGWAEEVTRVPRSDVLAFYDRWYQPGNCTLVVAGGIDADHALRRIEELFAPIAGSPVPELEVPQEPPQEGERRVELELLVQVPRMVAAFRTVRARDPDDPVLDVVQNLLTIGKSSRLYDRLVRREGLCAEISAWNDARRDPGLFYVMMELQSEVDPARAEAAVWDEIARLGQEGPSPEELDRVKSMTRAGLVFRRATAAGTADLVGTMQVHADDWRLAFQVEERIGAVTAEDVVRAVHTYLRRANRTVAWAVPRPVDAPPKPELPGDEIHEQRDEAPDENRGEPEILSRVPPRGAAPVDLPVRRVVLPNGLRVLLLRRGGAPVLAVRAYADAGVLRETLPGSAAFSGACLDEGAGGRTGSEISRFLESRGASLQAGSLGASLRCLVDDGPAAADILRDIVMRPDFPLDVVERKRGELIADVFAEDDDPSFVGRERARSEIYGPHPWARRDKGGEAELRSLTRDDLLRHHARWFVPRNAIVAAVGDLPVDRLEELVASRFGAWEDRPVPPPLVPAPPAPGEPRLIRLEQDRDQLHIYLGHLGIRRDHPDYHALLVADMILGSGPGFTDRLSKRLRDQLGLAYTVWARIARGSDIEPGAFMAYIGTAPKQREVALEEMHAEIQRFVDGGVTEREVDDAKSYLLGSYVFGFETADLTAEHIVHLERLGLGFDYPREYARVIAALTPSDVNGAVRRHILPGSLITVMVGRTGK